MNSMRKNSYSDSSSESNPRDQLKLEPNALYSGLKSYSKASRFSYMSPNPTFKFPILNISEVSVDPKSCFHPSKVNVAQTHTLLSSRSPFSHGNHSSFRLSLADDHSEHEVPENSINSHISPFQSFTSYTAPFNLAEEMEKNHISFTSSYISSAPNTSNSPEKAEISLNTREIIMNIHRNFAAQLDDDLHLNSITPASSLALSRLQGSMVSVVENENFNSYADVSVEIQNANNSQHEEPWGIYIRKTEESFKRSGFFVELGGEEQGGENMFKSIDSGGEIEPLRVTEEDMESPDDEGPLMISTARLFLNGETASKAKLIGPASRGRIIRQLSQKTITENLSQALSTVPETQPCIDFPDSSSPMLKKLVFLVPAPLDSAEIVAAVACSGFGSSVIIEYSSDDSKNRCFAGDNKGLWQGLWDLSASKLLMKVQMEWVSCGFEHMACVSAEGKVMTWGYGASGCLGHGDTRSCMAPTLVNSLFEERVVYIECGAYHTVCNTEEGEVWAWGRGDVNQIGLPLTKLLKDEVGYVALRPLKLKECSSLNISIKALACGEAHTLLLDADGKVYSFGWAIEGQLGQDEISTESSSMKQVEAMTHKVVKISAGCLFSVCLTDMGQVFVWGNGEQGQLGCGNLIKGTNFPTLVSSLRHEFVIDVMCGESSVICLTQSGALYGWGKGVTGHFSDSDFRCGSDIISFIPRILPRIDSLQKYFVKNETKKMQDFNTDLFNKLRVLSKKSIDNN